MIGNIKVEEVGLPGTPDTTFNRALAIIRWRVSIAGTTRATATHVGNDSLDIINQHLAGTHM